MTDRGLDGFEVCARLTRMPRIRLAPVVVVTGLGALLAARCSNASGERRAASRG